MKLSMNFMIYALSLLLYCRKIKKITEFKKYRLNKKPKDQFISNLKKDTLILDNKDKIVPCERDINIVSRHQSLKK